jgi:hypothetical protein
MFSFFVPESIFKDLIHAAASFVEEHVVALRGVDLQGSSCSDELLVQMKDWCFASHILFAHFPTSEYFYVTSFMLSFVLLIRYNHEIPRPPRRDNLSGFPLVRAAEVLFIRQIQKLMFDVYVENISLLVMNSWFLEVRYLHMILFYVVLFTQSVDIDFWLLTSFRQAFEEVKANCTGNYTKAKITARLLAPDSMHVAQQSQIKCMVGKFVPGQSSEEACKAMASKIADLALSMEFKQRAENLKACLHPQLFACNCRLMVDDLMSILPTPKCEQDSYGADHLANFHDLLWHYVLVPLLMTDHSNCANLFVKLLSVREYGNSAGHIDVAEMRIKELISCLSSNSFFIKGQSLRGCDVDDHFLSVSPL